MISLAHPAFLLVGGILLLPYGLRPRRAWYYSSLQLLRGRKPSSPSALLTSGVTLGALLLLLLALARPQAGSVRTQHVLEARDIVLTLDLSLSMDSAMAHTGDEKSVRKLDLIQRAALTFVKRHQHDRLGLIVFGDDAFGVWPLSTDTTVLEHRLQHLDRLLPSELRGTRVQKALVKSLHHLQELGQSRSKMLLLLTDGLDTIDPTAAERIVQRLRSQHVTLYVLGMELGKDASLVRFVRQAQGRYFNIENAQELEQAFRDIDRLETSRLTVIRAGDTREIYPLFAFPGLLLLLFSTILKSTWVLEV